jgi:lysophospholipase L1-like esterase
MATNLRKFMLPILVLLTQTASVQSYEESAVSQKPGWVPIAKQRATVQPVDPTLWYDVRELEIEGKGWQDTDHFYDRLPGRAKGVVREAVWELGQQSAGLCVRFVTDATRIQARWTLRSDHLALEHMPATGVSGLDLYVCDNGGGWQWLGVGRPSQFPVNQKVLVEELAVGTREYLLYLPLYNGVESVQIGLAPEAFLAKGPPRQARLSKPICVYGTSITQGGCASRPGMAYTAILGRRLDRPVINLGFSGNGPMELEVGRFMAELDPALYVLDCLPNMEAQQVSERAVPFVKLLRQSRPETPIVLVENIAYPNSGYVPARRESYTSKNAALEKAYQQLVAEGFKRIFYLRGDQLLGQDGEPTVDGTHPTDLGFLRMADVMAPVLREALNATVHLEP